MKITVIIWADTVGLNGWVDEAGMHDWASDNKNGEIQSVGFLVAEEDAYLVLAQSFNQVDVSYGNLLRIPRSAIIWITTLPEVKSDED